MEAREIQAKNMAQFLIGLDATMSVIICGKTYKPLVPFTDGSSSILVAHYVLAAGREVYFSDPLTGDRPPETGTPAIYLLAHDPVVTYGEQLSEIGIGLEISHPDERNQLSSQSKGRGYSCARGSYIVDPWRKFPRIEGINVIHYGNTRK